MITSGNTHLKQIASSAELEALPRGAVIMLASNTLDPTEFTVAHREWVTLPHKDVLRWFVGELSNNHGDGHESAAIWHIYADRVRPRLLFVHDGSALT